MNISQIIDGLAVRLALRTLRVLVTILDAAGAAAKVDDQIAAARRRRGR